MSHFGIKIQKILWEAAPPQTPPPLGRRHPLPNSTPRRLRRLDLAPRSPTLDPPLVLYNRIYSAHLTNQFESVRLEYKACRWPLWCRACFSVYYYIKYVSLKARCAALKASMCIINIVILLNTITDASKINVSDTETVISFRGLCHWLPYRLAFPRSHACVYL